MRPGAIEYQRNEYPEYALRARKAAEKADGTYVSLGRHSSKALEQAAIAIKQYNLEEEQWSLASEYETKEARRETKEAVKRGRLNNARIYIENAEVAKKHADNLARNSSDKNSLTKLLKDKIFAIIAIAGLSISLSLSKFDITGFAINSNPATPSSYISIFFLLIGLACSGIHIKKIKNN